MAHRSHNAALEQAVYRQVLYLEHAVNDGEGFVNFSDPSFHGPDKDVTESSFRSFEITVKDWEEMGEPDTITITVQMGDRLNKSNGPDTGWKGLGERKVKSRG